MTTNNEGAVAIVFPWYYGTRVRHFGSSLLWFGHLNTFVSPFASPFPAETFKELADLATERKSPLLDLFNAAGFHCFSKSKESINEFSKASEGLEKKIGRIAAISPGGIDHYAAIRADFAPAVAKALRIEDEELLRVACAQFVWRCHEYYLETGNRPNETLDLLESQEKVIGGWSLLLAECLLNHFVSWRQSPGSLVCDNQSSIDLLANLMVGTEAGDELASLKPPVVWTRHRVASSLFERTLSNLCPPIGSGSAPFYVRILENRKAALASAKRKCYIAADKLIEKASKPEVFETLFVDTVREMRAEVAEIAELDDRAWSSFVGKLLEEKVTWAGGAGLVTAAVAGMPPVAIAAAAVTLFGVVGAQAVASHREAKKALTESDWCFVYELRRAEKVVE